MDLHETYPRLIARLLDLRSHWRQRHVLAGSCLALAICLAVWLAAALADVYLDLPAAGRWTAAILLAAALAIAWSRLVLRRWLADPRDDFFALLVEERYPALDNRLINALQLGRGNHYGSPRLVQQIVADALEATAELDLEPCARAVRLRRPAASLAAALGVLLLALLMAPGHLAASLVRVAIPWADVPPYTATRVTSVTPANKRTYEGVPLTISAQIEGRVPEAVFLHVRRPGRPWRTLVMQPPTKKPDARSRAAHQSHAAPSAYAHTLREPRHTFDYFVSAGDGRSRQYRIEVVRNPRIERLEASLAPPAYTGRRATPFQASSGDIAALCGSTVRLRLQADKSLTAARLVFEHGPALQLARAGNGRTWSASFTLWSEQAHGTPPEPHVLVPTRYQIQLDAADGSRLRDTAWHALAPLRDQPPRVAFVEPARDVQARPHDTVRLLLAARDDHGVGPIRLLYRVGEQSEPQQLALFAPSARPQRQRRLEFTWELAAAGFKGGDVVQYWAEAQDLNHVTGPGTAESTRYHVFVVTPETALAELDVQLDDYAQVLEELIRLQAENRSQTAAGVGFEPLVVRQVLIRTRTASLAQAMQADPLAPETMAAALLELHAGLMAQAVRLLEAARDAQAPNRAAALREESLPVQDRILEALQALLARLQRNQQARAALKRMARTDQAAHTAVTNALAQLVKDLDRMLDEQQELADKFERQPKRPVQEFQEPSTALPHEELAQFAERWQRWAKGTVDELAKLPTGFVDDFGLREDVNTVFEEIEAAAQRARAEKIEVALEDLGASMATRMLEDLELWMPSSPDATQWVLEEPLAQAPLEIPEMPLPDALEDLIGDLLQQAEEFDQEADDVTSAWGDNLNQAGWDVADGPISSFSAKGKTGNDLPNQSEMSGRSGDGRRGKSSGQSVGDTARGLEGRKTPARVGAEQYEPGQIEQEAEQDPQGATGGGKKSGAGRRGLQGGTPPDFVRDMERLSQRQAGLRERAQQVAQRLEAAGVSTVRLQQAIELMRSAEEDLRDLRYEDAAAKRQVALQQLRSALEPDDRGTAAIVSRAQHLPTQLREELLQAADEAYPEGYETLVREYFKTLSEEEP